MNGIKIIERGPSSELLRKRCREHKIPVQLIRELVKAELEQIGKLRKRGLTERFDEIFENIEQAT